MVAFSDRGSCGQQWRPESDVRAFFGFCACLQPRHRHFRRGFTPPISTYLIHVTGKRAVPREFGYPRCRVRTRAVLWPDRIAQTQTAYPAMRAPQRKKRPAPPTARTIARQGTPEISQERSVESGTNKTSETRYPEAAPRCVLQSTSSMGKKHAMRPVPSDYLL